MTDFKNSEREKRESLWRLEKSEAAWDVEEPPLVTRFFDYFWFLNEKAAPGIGGETGGDFFLYFSKRPADLTDYFPVKDITKRRQFTEIQMEKWVEKFIPYIDEELIKKCRILFYQYDDHLKSNNLFIDKINFDKKVSINSWPYIKRNSLSIPDFINFVDLHFILKKSPLSFLEFTNELAINLLILRSSTDIEVNDWCIAYLLWRGSKVATAIECYAYYNWAGRFPLSNSSHQFAQGMHFFLKARRNSMFRRRYRHTSVRLAATALMKFKSASKKPYPIPDAMWHTFFQAVAAEARHALVSRDRKVEIASYPTLGHIYDAAILAADDYNAGFGQIEMRILSAHGYLRERNFLALENIKKEIRKNFLIYNISQSYWLEYFDIMTDILDSDGDKILGKSIELEFIALKFLQVDDFLSAQSIQYSAEEVIDRKFIFIERPKALNFR